MLPVYQDIFRSKFSNGKYLEVWIRRYCLKLTLPLHTTKVAYKIHNHKMRKRRILESMDSLGKRGPLQSPDTGGGSSPAERMAQREAEARQTLIAEAAAAAYRKIEDRLSKLGSESRSILKTTFDSVKNDILPKLDIDQVLGISPTLPGAEYFVNRTIIETLADTVTSIEQFKDVERLYPDFFELFSFEEQYAMRAKVEARSRK